MESSAQIANHPINARLVAKPAIRLHSKNHKIEYYILYQIACQLALLIPSIGGIRSFVRFSAFGASFIMLALLYRRRERHPATKPAAWVLAIVGLSILHPTTNSFAAGIAEAALYFAIMAPLFWVPGLKLDLSTMMRVL